MMQNIFVIIIAILMAIMWQLGFNTISDIFLFTADDASAEYLSIIYFIQSFLMGFIPTAITVYFSSLSIFISSLLLLGTLIIATIIIEIWIGGLVTVIGLALATSAWIFLLGAISACFVIKHFK